MKKTRYLTQIDSLNLLDKIAVDWQFTHAMHRISGIYLGISKSDRGHYRLKLRVNSGELIIPTRDIVGIWKGGV